MDQQQAIAFNNLIGEVTLLREIVKALSTKLMPFEPASTQTLIDACASARKQFPDMSAERIAVDHAINELKPHNWVGRK